MQKSENIKLVENEKITKLRFYDPSTGLPNINMFTDRLGIAIQNTKQFEEYFYAVLFLKLERSKEIIDRTEHIMIDEILIKLGSTLSNSLRSIDTVARISGFEFTILLENVIDVAEVEHTAHRIWDNLTSEFIMGSRKLFDEAIIGIVFSDIRYEKPEQVLNDAETAMHRAKARGISHDLFRASVKTEVKVSQSLEADLLKAFDRQEFEIYYQPIVSLQYHNITGSEALIRWKHPRRGYISPPEFIPLLERTGLIIPIGEWVMLTACKQTKAWQDAFNSKLRVSVNCSPLQFHNRSFFDTISNSLKKTNLPPDCLSIEVTESTAMRNVDITAITLKRLSDLGIKVSIDDFGTGYSSLAYLKEFPVNCLKIDKSFVDDISGAYEDASIISAIISMAQSLNLKIIAEGVETDEQLSYLISKKCDEIQGFVFSPAISADKFSNLLNENKTLSSATLDKTKLQWGRKPLGGSLVLNGYITKGQLNIALQEQKETKQKLGKVLVKKGYISEDVLIEALGRQHGTASINLFKKSIDREVLSLIPKEIVKKYKTIPLGFTNAGGEDKLIVAMANPSDMEVIKTLAFITGFSIDPIFFTEEDFERIIPFHY